MLFSWLSKIVNNFKTLLKNSMNIDNADQSAPRPCVSCNIYYGTQASEWLCSGCCKY
jgi:hypothetical protein